MPWTMRNTVWGRRILEAKKRGGFNEDDRALLGDDFDQGIVEELFTEHLIFSDVSLHELAYVVFPNLVFSGNTWKLTAKKRLTGSPDEAVKEYRRLLRLRNTLYE